MVTAAREKGGPPVFDIRHGLRKARDVRDVEGVGHAKSDHSRIKIHRRVEGGHIEAGVAQGPHLEWLRKTYAADIVGAHKAWPTPAVVCRPIYYKGSTGPNLYRQVER